MLTKQIRYRKDLTVGVKDDLVETDSCVVATGLGLWFSELVWDRTEDRRIPVQGATGIVR